MDTIDDPFMLSETHRMKNPVICLMKKLLFVSILTAFVVTANAVEKTPPSPENIPGTILVDAEAVIKLVMSTPDIIIIDARIKTDRKQGYIEGSISLPNIDTNCGSLNKIIKEKTTPALYYCNGIKCGRSVESISIAMSCGYSNIYWFRGGFEEWQEKGYPVVES